MGEKQAVHSEKSLLEKKVKELRTELERARQELRIRTDLARVITSFTSPEELLPNVLNVLCDGFGASGGAIYFMEKGSDRITLKATYGLDASYAIRYQEIHLGSHVTGLVAETGEGMIIKDSARDSRSTKGVVEILKYRSAVVTPVTSKGEVVGIIALISETPDFFTERDLKLLEFMGAHISLAIVNSFLNQEINEEKTKTLDILEQVDEGIFEVEVPAPIDNLEDVEKVTLEFYKNAVFTLVNPSFRRQCGNDDIVHGTPMYKGFEDIQLFRMLKEVLRNGSVKGIERRWAGEEEHLFEVSMVLMEKEGSIKGVKGIRRDVTKRKKIEEELRESKARTELYMDILSHDISNMNTAIMGYLDILKERIDKDSGLKVYIERCGDAVTRASQMVKKVRGLSRVQKSGPELSMADLIERVQIAFEIVKAETPARSIQLELKNGGTPIFIRCDEMIDELLTNLFRNSIQTVDKPSVEIRMEIREWEFNRKAGHLLSVTDNGEGVPDSVRERVMKGIRDSEKDTEEGAAGKELGLLLVKSITERYGGKLWIENRMVGENRVGSKIMLFFPGMKSSGN
ncbi:MAG: hypothetical protein DRN57_07800 [Thermoplasmata archaeon]|nr:MAG: hypothetical protein DRN57_07800 [Thermoplasmata archaeon]